MPLNQLHDRYLDVVFERAGLDGHPSPTMLDVLERAVTDRDDLEAYLDALLSVSERQRHPSPRLLRRTITAVRALALLDALEAGARERETA